MCVLYWGCSLLNQWQQMSLILFILLENSYGHKVIIMNRFLLVIDPKIVYYILLIWWISINCESFIIGVSLIIIFHLDTLIFFLFIHPCWQTVPRFREWGVGIVVVALCNSISKKNISWLQQHLNLDILVIVVAWCAWKRRRWWKRKMFRIWMKRSWKVSMCWCELISMCHWTTNM
jgi:hypothetical protein